MFLWVLGAAYQRARERGRDLGLAVLLVGGGVLLFAASALAPRPPVSVMASKLMVVGSVILLGTAMVVILWRGFRE